MSVSFVPSIITVFEYVRVAYLKFQRSLNEHLYYKMIIYITFRINSSFPTEVIYQNRY